MADRQPFETSIAVRTGSGAQWLSYVAFAGAVVGAMVGAYIFVLHLTTDPLADVHAYYEAGARLNAGQPLYEQPATTAEARTSIAIHRCWPSPSGRWRSSRSRSRL